jgi:hypothetical protein
MDQEIDRGTESPHNQGRPEMGSKANLCSHAGCRCALDTRYVALGARAFCCGDCADGTGCDHETCHCGEARAPAGLASLLHGAVRHLQRSHSHKE